MNLQQDTMVSFGRDTAVQGVLEAYRFGWQSRFVSILGRKEVLSGKAKFGIFGDGKELPQLALAAAVRKGDWRSGYYRDQTLMLATGAVTLTQLFAQLYADVNLDHEPCSGGRQMNAHFATRFLDAEGRWLSQMHAFQSSSDISPTAGQMARALGLAFASKAYRGPLGTHLAEKDIQQFSYKGEEVCFCTIGNAATSEGLFWETMNAACVEQVPLVVSVWDDEYGISVPNILQTAKGSISLALQGMSASSPDEKGLHLDLYVVDGRDFGKLSEVYQHATSRARRLHRPSLVHVTHLTQPLGHSTSGSHERYKDEERLRFETSNDCLDQFHQWILTQGYADESRLEEIKASAEAEVQRARDMAWKELSDEFTEYKHSVAVLLGDLQAKLLQQPAIRSRSDLATWLRQQVVQEKYMAVKQGRSGADWVPVAKQVVAELSHLYTSHLVAQVREHSWVQACYASSLTYLDAREIILRFFDMTLSRDPRVLIFGEDVGCLGGVNLEFEGLQAKHGESRIFDTGIREATILGQGIGAALRGLRPIVDIQYLDYLVYALQGLTDDLASLHYRTAGGQIAPVIVRTKGHRLEGVWHTGSPMGMILSTCHGMSVCVPRNATQAAGMYHYLLHQNTPAIVVEVLNGYRLKEALPANLGEYHVVPGVCEVLQVGKDVTLVTYGACVRIALEAASMLAHYGVEMEVIDVQTLLPFDDQGKILSSLMKTSSLIILDEDVPGGASAYILEQVLVHQEAYQYLDAKPCVICASPNRAAYGNDGNYFCKPSVEDVVEQALELRNLLA
ncbi:MAG: thiamine pyrophosphate-dependent enzyme [Zetaproteobacteria bacterium]|nr:thiamine pyrophosphate-dependent enzyme [Zetaproteobacteria bacterium]